MKIQGPWTKDKRYKATKAIKIVVLDEIMKQQAMEKTSLTIETQNGDEKEGQKVIHFSILKFNESPVFLCLKAKEFFF